jgi:uncharacterized RDD family membrane protein YckC
VYLSKCGDESELARAVRGQVPARVVGGLSPHLQRRKGFCNKSSKKYSQIMTPLSKIEVEQVVRTYNPQMGGEIQNVRKIALQIPVANSWQRLIHYVIDLNLCVFAFFFLAGLFGFDTTKEEGDFLQLWAYYLFYLPYCLIMETIFGQTLGKMVMGNVVINDYAEKPTFANIAARTAVRLVPFLPMALLWQEVPYHDIWTKTYVVSKKEVDRLKAYVNK